MSNDQHQTRSYSLSQMIDASQLGRRNSTVTTTWVGNLQIPKTVRHLTCMCVSSVHGRDPWQGNGIAFLGARTSTEMILGKIIEPGSAFTRHTVIGMLRADVLLRVTRKLGLVKPTFSAVSGTDNKAFSLPLSSQRGPQTFRRQVTAARRQTLMLRPVLVSTTMTRVP